MSGVRWWLAMCAVVWFSPAAAQEYRIGKEAPESAPVHLTEPVEGRVEIVNPPAVQDVRIVDGALPGPIEVRGEVGLRPGAPLQVEVVNPQPLPETIELGGPVQIDDTPAVRVWVENMPQPLEPPAPSPRPAYVAYAFEGAFGPKDVNMRRTFSAPAGRTFHATDLILDARPDAALRVRLSAEAAAIAGTVTGQLARGGYPLLVLDSRDGAMASVQTTIPLTGAFVIEAEAVGPGQGVPFRVLLAGFVE